MDNFEKFKKIKIAIKQQFLVGNEKKLCKKNISCFNLPIYEKRAVTDKFEEIENF